MIKFFTYGTFRKGECRHHILQKFSAQFLGTTMTANKYRLVDLGSFPGMIEDGSEAVVGELYNISEDAIPMFDAIESHPSFFYRTEVELNDGTTAVSYIFPHNVEESKNIQTGDWVNK